MEITKEEKQLMLKIVRNSIAEIFEPAEELKIDKEKYPALKKKCGAFVTLTINKMLRGCVGYIVSDRPLIELLPIVAKKSAQEDTRFTPLEKNELNEISIEISILSEPFKMNSYDDIVVGKHGLILSERYNRGLLLPQVPKEHGMDKEGFLTALCQKAGLPPYEWKKKTLNIEMFTAAVFSEREEYEHNT
ncbi:MAG: AmmeMemoRadiSam system protein A [Ignavibacteria bacterium]|nr:AmmeMemoRadiSam system protein A [Ignavibacteria bacterium]